MKHTINGCEIEIDAPDDGGLVTDVVVLTRVVRHSDDGRLADSILINSTTQTTGIIQAGMLAVADGIVNDWTLDRDD